ncbi:hypothetical protein ILYODFUR_033606 [Ilyodon furcidens]|uniref:Uncharacterized protein n=1 Tax=Ilyodon furcidens TaxID=33524 RepID=A0ABV0UNG9_9TELE
MSVTLEQCMILREQHTLSQQHFSSALDSMRRSGCLIKHTCLLLLIFLITAYFFLFYLHFQFSLSVFLSFNFLSSFSVFLFLSDLFHTCTPTLFLLQVSSVLGADAGLLCPLRVLCFWV